MVEKDAVAGKHPVTFPVVHRKPVSVDLGRAVRAARVKWRCLTLRDFLYLTIHFGAARLIELRLQSCFADGFQNPNRAQPGYVPRVFGAVKAHRHVALRGKIIDLIRLGSLNNAKQVIRIRHVAVMQKQAYIGVVRILVEVIDTHSIER